MKKELAIRGHETRGKEIIELLEMLGGENLYSKCGSKNDLFYYLSNEQRICSLPISESYRDFILFTFEEFLEKFPYKVGDKVMTDDGDKANIIGMVWDNDINDVFYEIQICNEVFKYPKELLQPYKEETMKEEIKIDIPKGYEYAGVDVDNQQVVFTKIQPEYPKTYEECCEILGIRSDWHLTLELDTPATHDLSVTKEFDYVIKLESLRKLSICRDAYWKIAGEQMGLGKPWEPDWEESDGGYRYCIVNRSNKIELIREWLGKNYILSFPTEEMRDSFSESEEIAQLISSCKEFL